MVGKHFLHSVLCFCFLADFLVYTMHLVSTCCVPGTVLGSAESLGMIKADRALFFVVT